MKRKLFILGLILLNLIFIFAANSTAGINHYTYKIKNKFPHDRKAFTQGLAYGDGYLFEGTGLKGHSTLRQVKPASGKIIRAIDIPPEYFGEGITIFEDRIIQLTWKSGTGFVYNKDLKLVDKFNYSREGWGLTHNNEHLIMSDGTETLYYLNPYSFETHKKLEIKMNDKPVTGINELEYIGGQIYANIWREDYIIIINPATGQVTGIINLEGIINPGNYNFDINVLNGIAYDNINDRLFVTGKLWPLLFEIEVIPVN